MSVALRDEANREFFSVPQTTEKFFKDCKTIDWHVDRVSTFAKKKLYSIELLMTRVTRDAFQDYEELFSSRYYSLSRPNGASLLCSFTDLDLILQMKKVLMLLVMIVSSSWCAIPCWNKFYESAGMKSSSYYDSVGERYWRTVEQHNVQGTVEGDTGASIKWHVLWDVISTSSSLK